MKKSSAKPLPSLSAFNRSQKRRHYLEGKAEDKIISTLRDVMHVLRNSELCSGEKRAVLESAMAICSGIGEVIC